MDCSREVLTVPVVLVRFRLFECPFSLGSSVMGGLSEVYFGTFSFPTAHFYFLQSHT